MFRYHNDILTIEASALINELDLISKSNYKLLCHRKKLQVVQRGGNGRKALIAWETMPEKYQTLIMAMTGDPYKRVKKEGLVDELGNDPKAAEYYSTYQLDDGRHLPEDVQRTYRINAQILTACNNRFNRLTSKRKSLGGSTKGIWQTIVDEVNDLSKKIYPHNLPSHQRKLRDRMNAFVKDGYQSLIHKGYQNKNSKKVTAKLEQLIISLYCMPQKPYMATVHELYQDFMLGDIADVVNVRTGVLYDRADFMKDGCIIGVSKQTVFNICNDPKNRAVIAKCRVSELEYNSTHRPHHSRHKPYYSLSKISMDDRDLPRKMHDGSRMKVYYAYDVLSGAIIGFSHSRKKDTKLFLDCIRDMFKFLHDRSLGVPLEVEVEHHLVNQFKDDLMQAGNVFPIVRWCNAGNSQEKHAEHYNKRLKYGYEKRWQTGIGRFYAKQEANRPKIDKTWDEEGMKIVEKKYSYQEILAEALYAQDAYNNDLHPDQKTYPGMSRLDVLLFHLNPELPQIKKYLLCKYAGKRTDTSIRRSMYCMVQHNQYILPSPEILGRLAPNNLKVEAYYMPSDDIKEVYLYQNGVYICKCEKLVKYNTARAEWTEADEKAYENQSKYVAEYDAMIKRDKSRITAIQLMDEAPVIEETKEELIVAELPVEEIDTSDDWMYETEDYAQRAFDSL